MKGVDSTPSATQYPIHAKYNLGLHDTYPYVPNGIIRKMPKEDRIALAIERIEQGQKVYFAICRVADASPFEFDIYKQVKQALKAKGHETHKENSIDNGYCGDVYAVDMIGILNGKDLWITLPNQSSNEKK